MEEENTMNHTKTSILMKGSLIEEEDASMDFMYSNRSESGFGKPINELAERKRVRAQESGAMEEEGGILGFENDRIELAGYKDVQNQQDDYIEDLIQQKMLQNAGMRKIAEEKEEEEDEDYIQKKKVQKKKFMITLNDPLSFNGVCKGYMTL